MYVCMYSSVQYIYFNSYINNTKNISKLYNNMYVHIFISLHKSVRQVVYMFTFKVSNASSYFQISIAYLVSFCTKEENVAGIK